MNKEERDRIVERIRRCLALGDKSRNPSEAEAETAVRMAKNLMAEYNLSMADVANANMENAFGPMVEVTYEKKSTPPMWENLLVKVCVELFGIYSFIRRTENADKIVFCGRENDVAISMEVYKLLKLEIMSLGSRWERENRNLMDWNYLSDGQWRTRRWKYQEGVVYTLVKRAHLQSEELSKADAEKSTALVVRKENDARNWAKEKYQLVQSHNRPSGLHGDAFGQGQRDGNKVGLDFKNKVRNSNGQQPKLIGG